jgi:hypothetical protein
MSEEELKAFAADTKRMIENGEKFLKEEAAMQRTIDFLINEYHTNKRWFREEPGHVTIEDIIRMTATHTWASKRQFDYDQSKK